MRQDKPGRGREAVILPLGERAAVACPQAMTVRVRPLPAPGFFRRLLHRFRPGLRLAQDLRDLRDCGLFDAGWYLARYPDVAADGMDPARHYHLHGAREGRDPGPGFSTAGYFCDHPDVAASGENPVLHYARLGLRQGHQARPAAELTRPVSALSDPPFDLARLPVVCLEPAAHPVSDLRIGPGPGRVPGAVTATRATLLADLATRPPARLIIDWAAITAEPSEWSGLWQLDDMTLTRQVMDALRIARDRGWQIALRGRVDTAEAPLFSTVSGLIGTILAEGEAP